MAVLVATVALFVDGEALASHEGCTSNLSSFSGDTLHIVGQMAGCQRGTLTIGAELYGNGEEIPGGGVDRHTCDNSTSCSFLTRSETKCWVPGEYYVVVNGRHNGQVDSPVYFFDVSDADIPAAC